MNTLTVSAFNLYSGAIEEYIYHNVKGFLDVFSVKRLSNKGLKVIDEKIEQ